MHLHGKLKEFGDKFDLAFNAPLDAVRLLIANFPKIEAYLREGCYKVIVGDLNCGDSIGIDEVFIESHGDLHIVPVIAGSGGKGGGVGKTILGVVLIATAFALPGAQGLATPALWGLTTYGGIALFGAGLVLSGISQIIAPTIKTKQESYNGQANAPSFIFTGASQVEAQGNAIPLVFGRVIVGSVVVSTGVQTYRMAV